MGHNYQIFYHKSVLDINYSYYFIFKPLKNWPSESDLILPCNIQLAFTCWGNNSINRRLLLSSENYLNFLCVPRENLQKLTYKFVQILRYFIFRIVLNRGGDFYTMTTIKYWKIYILQNIRPTKKIYELE